MTIRRSIAGILIVLMAGLLLPLTALAAAPDAVDDAATFAEDDPAVLVDVLFNDTDVDGDSLTVVDKTNGAKGLVVIAGDEKSLTYNPVANANGPDSFTYTISDGNGGQDTATVDVTITPSNDDPVADSESVQVTEDIDETIEVLVGDTDVDGDSLTILSSTNGTKGTTSRIDGNSKIEYDPNPNATGSDSFTYTISDGNGGEDTATVLVTIDDVNDAPTADDDSTNLDEDAGPTFIDVLDGDTDVDDPSDSLIVSAVTQGSKGAVGISTGGSGVTYIPNLNATGGDTFTYTVSDGDDTDTGTVTVTIDAENDPPNAVSNSYTIDEDTSALLDVLVGDTDADGDDLSISLISDPPNGSVSEEDDKVRYDPDSNVDGADSFTYTVSDGNGGFDSATVSVTITPVNDDPIADDDSFPMLEDAPATSLPVLAGDVDPDGDTLSISGKTNGTKGTVAITGSGSGLTYDPRTNEVGLDTFTYTISDGHGGVDTATVTVDIGGANDKPNAVNDTTMTVPQGAGAVQLDVLANDVDPDGDAFSILSIKPAVHGTVTITGSGTGLTYNPAGLFHGTNSFKYTITDGSLTDEASVSVTVVPDTDDPVVVAPAQRFIGQTAGSSTTKVRLTWSATDAGVGVASYKLQVSTNGGSYKTVSLSKKTSTSIDRTLTTGKSYRFRVRATDKEGNVSSYQYGPRMTPTRFSQDNSHVTYVGSWPKTTPTKALGGSARHATASTKSATFTFTGYDIGWITTRMTSSGKAQVLIDGAPISTIDLDTSSTAYRKLVFQRHFAVSGPHSITIKPIGDGRVDIDGFVVLK